MRNLLILTGPPGSGKSSWVKEHNLEEYSLNFDSLRIMMGRESINSGGYSNFGFILPSDARNFFLKALESRLKQGFFTIIDNTNLKESNFNDYRDLALKHGYSLYYKEFGKNINPEILYRRIKSRRSYIDLERIVEMKDNQIKLIIPSSFKKIKSIEDIEDVKNYNKIYNYDDDTTLYVVGDIHGCYNEFKKFISQEYDVNHMYIFVGDYIDRGYNDKEIINTLIKLQRTNGNIITLEGNHEKWLRYWSNSSPEFIRSREFVEYTKGRLEESPSLKHKKARGFIRNLKLFTTVKLRGKTYFISHGGSNSSLNPNSLSAYNLKSADHYIKGDGRYSDILNMYKTGSKFFDVVVHGHRGVDNQVKFISHYNDTEYYNLETSIEKGGHLSFVKFSKDKDPEIGKIKSQYNYLENVKRLVSRFRDVPKLVREGDTSNSSIKSFNFTKDAFFNKKWSSLVCKARGLFINIDNYTIGGRGYQKFFNKNEVPSTVEESIKNKVFPLHIYKKENGFLGILYSKDGKNLVFNTKSGDLTDYALLFKDLFEKLTSVKQQTKLAEYLYSSNSSMCFEVIAKEDPHLTDYKVNDSLFILDIIKNEISFSKLKYSDLKEESKFLVNDKNIFLKVLYTSIYNPFDLDAFYEKIKLVKEEGFVVEDSSSQTNPFMFKIKTPLYLFKKYVRSYASHKDLTRLMKNISVNNIDSLIHKISILKEIPDLVESCNVEDPYKGKISVKDSFKNKDSLTKLVKKLDLFIDENLKI